MDDAKKVALAPRRLERLSVRWAPPAVPKDLVWCSPHAPFLPLTCASEARLQTARAGTRAVQAPFSHCFDPLWFGSPLWLCREPSRPKPLWYDMLLRVGRGLSTDVFPVACSRRCRLLARDPKVTCRCLLRRSLELLAPKSEKTLQTEEIRRPPKPENLFRGGGLLSLSRSREAPRAEARGFAYRVLRLGGGFSASVRRPPLCVGPKTSAVHRSEDLCCASVRRPLLRIGPKTCAPKPGASRAQARTRRLGWPASFPSPLGLSGQTRRSL